MGRDLKGKELGPGVMQRKDGNIPPDIQVQMVSDTRNILIKYQKQRNMSPWEN